MATPATVMIAVLASESQKNPQRSRFPSTGDTLGEGVELPGVDVYGVRKFALAFMRTGKTGRTFS